MNPAASPYGLLVIEGFVTAVALGAVACCARKRERRAGPFARTFRKLAARRSLAVASVFVVTLAGQLLALPLFGIPEPQVGDEFGYLLAAETFASGRLTNTPHELWHHFETFHVLQQPSYMAMYPPGQGLLLAGGLALWGVPIVAVWISVAATAAAITWTLQEFGPARWALVGGLLFAIRLGVFSYWAWSYWGGALAALGGALVLGGAAGFARAATAGRGLALGTGLSLLAVTRPLEGLAVGIPAAVYAVLRIFRSTSRPSLLLARLRAGVIVALPVAGTLAGLAVWNRAVTGSAWTAPYSLQRSTYAVSRHLVGQTPRPEPSYRHEVMRDFYLRWEPEHFGRFSGRRELGGRPVAFIEKLAPLWTFFSGPAFTPALLFLPCFLARRRNVLATASLASAFLAFLAVSWWVVPHYAAPAAAGIWLVVVEGLRRLAVAARRFRIHRDAPLIALVGVLSVVTVIRTLAPRLNIRVGSWPPAWYSTVRYAGYTRAALEADLLKRGGRHLVFVRYGPGHSPHLEWVYNAADLAVAPILWARSMGPEADARLRGYEQGRTAWLLEPDTDPWKLIPYDPCLAASAGTRRVR